MSSVVNLEQKTDASDPGVIETPTGGRIRFILEDCQARRARGAVSGPPGCGKTFQAEQYAAASPGAVLITLTRAYGSQRAGLEHVVTSLIEDPLVRQLSEDARLSPIWNRKTQLYCSVLFSHLRQILCDLADARDAPDFLLIVDEAQFASPELLDHLRSATEHGVCGLVLLGNHELFMPRRGRTDAAPYLALQDRFEYWLRIEQPTAGDVAAFLDHYRIAGRESRAFMTNIGTHTSYRQVKRIIARARAINGTPLVRLRDLKMAADMSGLLELGLGRR